MAPLAAYFILEEALSNSSAQEVKDALEAMYDIARAAQDDF